MQIKHKSLLTLLGLNIQGDLGGLTMYRSARHRFTIFAATTPKEPPSAWQDVQRNRWSAAAAAWAALSPAIRTQWRAAAQAARLRISAYNLWVHALTTNDPNCLATISAQTGIPLTTCPTNETT